MHTGEFAAAEALIEEASSVTASIGAAPPLLYTSIVIAAWRGLETPALALFEHGLRDAIPRGEGRAVSWGDYAIALLRNGLGDYQAAFEAAGAACAHDDIGLVAWAMVELVEAAARTDHRDVAAVTLERLAERTRASGTDWALGIEARSRALLSDGPEADKLYQESIERLGRSRIAVHVARAHLVYGEWLRREQRRIDAREQLRAAHDMFRRFGAEGFAERARRELQATGETVRTRNEDASRRPDRAGGTGRALGGRRQHELRDRCAAVHQPPNRGVPPAQGVHQARHQLPPAAPGPPRATRVTRGLTPRPGAAVAHRYPHSGLPQMRAHPSREDAAS